MSHHVYHFQASFEGVVTTQEIITFERGAGEITITNDHASSPLGFKFEPAEEYATVYPGESVTVNIVIRRIIIDGHGEDIPYRIWVWN